MPLEPIPKRLTHFGNGSVGSGAESRWFKSSRARHFIIDKKFFKTISIIFFTRFFCQINTYTNQFFIIISQ